MKLRDVAIRFRSRPVAPPMRVSLARQHECLADLRRELRSSYPSILSDRLIRIARGHGMDRFPEGFLVSGSIAEPGPTGARARLRQIRRNAAGQDGTFHPLFSNEFYRLRYADVAATGVPPWVHYQVFGRAENRTPHPLIDISYLAAWFPATSRGSILDTYLMSPDAWTADPSPYVDCQKFLLHGNWDGITNPLVQIVGQRLGTPWIHQRLLLIDSNSGETDAARTTGIGYLLSRSTARARLASVETWSSEPGETPATPATLTVVPGFFVAGNGRVISAPSGSMISPDATVLALPTEFLSIRSGTTISAPVLLFIDGPLDYTDLRAVVRAAVAGTAIAPFTAAHGLALRELAGEANRSDLTILEHGVQIRVSADALHFSERPIGGFSTPVWKGDVGTATDFAFVLTKDESQLLDSDARIRTAVRNGAAACILDTDSLRPWLPVLRGRTRIVCTPAALPYVLALVDRDRVSRHESRDRAIE